MQLYEGNFDASGQSYAIVAARFNQPVTDLLLKGALDCLKRHGVLEENIALAWVPGAFEIPLIAKKMAQSKKYQAVICLGVVIRGESAHFEYVAGQAASGVLQASLLTDTPIIFSILTTENKEQAEIRAGTKGMNAGFCGALSAIETANLLKHLE